MNAPFLWILLPILTGGGILLFSNRRNAMLIASFLCAILSLVALIIPIDTALLLGSYSIKIASSFQFFGRSFVLSSADGPLLGMIYGFSAIWFLSAEASNARKRFLPLGLMIVAFLTASIAVEPFLFAAPLLSMAAMLAIPMLVPEYHKAGRGVMRFLVFQIFAMPFILFSGWMIGGVEANLGDVRATLQVGMTLGVGFSFLLGVFPLYSWIPMAMEESSPYITGFLLWALPTFTVIFILGFFERYTWLATSDQLAHAMRLIGIIMVASGGIFASQQKHIGRIMGYGGIISTGLVILAMGLSDNTMVDTVFLLLIPRGLELVIWSVGLSILKRQVYSLQFSELKGIASKYPLAAGAVILANLSMTGFPLLAGFPSRLALLQSLTQHSLLESFWVFLGLIGLMVAAMRTLAVFVMADEGQPWSWGESWMQIILLMVGVCGLLVLGVFPQAIQPFTTSLSALFGHLMP